jgi:hypothetical protein
VHSRQVLAFALLESGKKFGSQGAEVVDWFQTRVLASGVADPKLNQVLFVQVIERPNNALAVLTKCCGDLVGFEA